MEEGLITIVIETEALDLENTLSGPIVLETKRKVEKKELKLVKLSKCKYYRRTITGVITLRPSLETLAKDQHRWMTYPNSDEISNKV